MLEAVGGHWYDDHPLYGHKSLTIEILHQYDPWGGVSDFNTVAWRLGEARARGLDCYVRIGQRPGNEIPPNGRNDLVYDFCNWLMQMAAHPYIGGRCRGFIIGNEPNLSTEGGVPAGWAARVVCGYTLPPDRTDCAAQFIWTANPDIEVFAPPVAPWSPDTSGDNSGLVLPDGRDVALPHELYQYDLAQKCYIGAASNHGHPSDESQQIGKVKFGIHTYGRVGWDGTANGGAWEPWTDVRGAGGAQWGTRWFQDSMYYISQGMLNSPYGVAYSPGGVIVSEANTFTDGWWPSNNYPVGWWKELAYYLRQFDNVMGVAGFVDRAVLDPQWARTAINGSNGRLPLWKRDHEELLRIGW
jgi:hypothetical protein